MSLTKHLLRRHYDPARYNTQWLDHDQMILTVPLFDFAGRLSGYQQYRPFAEKKNDNPKLAKYFTRGNGKQQPWGTELPLVPGPVFLTESVFKSASLHALGLNSWTLLGSDIAPQTKQQFSLLPYRFVCLGDDDKAGKKFSRTFGEGAVSPDLDELTETERWAVVMPFLL